MPPAKTLLDVYRPGIHIEVSSGCADDAPSSHYKNSVELSKLLESLPVLLIRDQKVGCGMSLERIQQKLVRLRKNPLFISNYESGSDVPAFPPFEPEFEPEFKNCAKDIRTYQFLALCKRFYSTALLRIVHND